MKHDLTNKKYGFFDFLRVPFRICPGYTAIKSLNSVLVALLPSVQIFATASFINTAISVVGGGMPRRQIILPLLFLALLVAYNYLNQNLISYVNLKYNQKIDKAFKSALIKKQASLDYRYIEDNDTWELITRVFDSPEEKLGKGYYSLISLLSIVIQISSLIIVISGQVWWAGPLMLVICLPLLIIAGKSGKDQYKVNAEAAVYRRKAGYDHEVLITRPYADEKTLFGYIKELNGKWFEKYERSRKMTLKMVIKYAVRNSIANSAVVVTSIILLGLLLFPLSRGEINIGIFTGIALALLGFTGNKLGSELTWITTDMVYNREYLNDLNAFCALTEKAGATDLPSESASFVLDEIEFKNVSFAYPGTQRRVLNNFSCRIKNGVHYAFVGVNGAGKTTVTKLLTGLYDNYEGEILINGRELREYTSAQLKAFFSVVFQDFSRYGVSLKDNISLGNVINPDDMEKINGIIDVIGLRSAVSNMHSGVESYLGKAHEQGVDISGGEWQRVALARALYSPAGLRILDEPTAALDPVAESRIYEIFGKISEGVTTIFITHRLGAAKLADEIIVIDDGAVKETGTHMQLIEKGGIYAAMYEAQRKWYS